MAAERRPLSAEGKDTCIPGEKQRLSWECPEQGRDREGQAVWEEEVVRRPDMAPEGVVDLKRGQQKSPKLQQKEAKRTVSKDSGMSSHNLTDVPSTSQKDERNGRTIT